jgi:hypothetical protein
VFGKKGTIIPAARSRLSNGVNRKIGRALKLPGNVIFFYIVPLYPAHSTGLAGHVPVRDF